MVKCRRNVNLEEIDTELASSTGKKKWILSTLRNIQGVHQTKYYNGSVKKIKFSFSLHLQIDKKLNVKEYIRRKTDKL